jgi:hypothetical protein
MSRTASRASVDTPAVPSPAAPTWRKGLLSVHIAAAVGALGTDAALLALGISGAGDADPETVYPAASLIGSWLVAPLAVTALVSGLLLGLLSEWGLVRYWWVTIKLAITATLVVVLLSVLLPALQDAADTATAGGELADADRGPLVAGPVVAVTLLALNVVLAVFKPGWRLRARP